MSRRFTLKEFAQLYNMAGKDRRKAAWRFSEQSWRSFMSHVQWEEERSIRKALETPKLELLNTMRHVPLQCEYHATHSMMGGAAMTKRECARCHRTEIYGSTATPNICNHCAFMTGICQYCDKPISEKSFKR